MRNLRLFADRFVGLVWKSTCLKRNPKEIAKETDVIITMLSTPEVIRVVATGDQGFLSSLKDNSIWLNCSTVNPSFTKEMEIVSKQFRVCYLNAPVAGTKASAENGELLFLVGGDTASVNEVSSYYPL